MAGDHELPEEPAHEERTRCHGARDGRGRGGEPIDQHRFVVDEPTNPPPAASRAFAGPDLGHAVQSSSAAIRLRCKKTATRDDVP